MFLSSKGSIHCVLCRSSPSNFLWHALFMLFAHRLTIACFLPSFHILDLFVSFVNKATVYLNLLPISATWQSLGSIQRWWCLNIFLSGDQWGPCGNCIVYCVTMSLSLLFIRTLKRKPEKSALVHNAQIGVPRASTQKSHVCARRSAHKRAPMAIRSKWSGMHPLIILPLNGFFLKILFNNRN